MSILTKSVSFLKRLRRRSSPDPVRDWLILFTVSLILFAGLIVWNIWTFDIVANGNGMGASTSVPAPVFNRASLDAVHTIFMNRAAEKTKYDSGTYSFVDPSQ